MAEDPKLDEFDLDEDLFGFDQAAGDFHTSLDDEEDLEAIFAAFQADDEEQEAKKPSRVEPVDTPEVVAPEPVAWSPAPEKTVEPVVSREVSAKEDTGEHQEPRAQRELVPQSSGDAEPSTPERRAGRDVVKAVIAQAPAASKSVLLILLSVTMLNGLVAIVMLQNTFSVRESVDQAKREITSARDEILDDKWESALETQNLRTPLIPPDPESHPTFERAKEQIARGEYAEARQSLYSLLSVIDRLEHTQRKAVESRALYLLAEATHLEALNRMGEGE